MKVKLRIKKEIGQYLKLQRDDRGKPWTVQYLATKLGSQKQQISQTLSGSIEPTMNFIHKFCALTGLRAEAIIETVFE